MAEAFPEEPLASELHPDEKVISVLLLASRWQFDTYGLSTVNKSLVNNLRLVDPEGITIKITCAVVEEQEKISSADVKDAENCGVVLKGAKRPMSRKRDKKPKLKWLDENTGTYYYHIINHYTFDFIIGHAPYLANGCFNLKDIYEEGERPLKIILMFHALPKDEDGDVDDEVLMDWLIKSDIVFPVGKTVESELVPYVTATHEKSRPIQKMYIPSYPLELFHIVRKQKGNEVFGTQNISMMSAEVKDLNITGLDFPLAVNATIGAAEHIRDFDGVRTNLTMLAAHEDDREKWKVAKEKIFKSRTVEHVGLSFKTEVPTDINKLQSLLSRSTLFLLPLRSDSPLFGTEALSAIAAGVPVLISKHSGLARFLRKISGDESVVYETKAQSSADTWKDSILERLLKPEESERIAKSLREKLLLDTSIAQGHVEFINAIARGSCVQLQIETRFNSDSKIPQQHLDAANRFGVDKAVGLNINTYVVAFLRKLLLLRERLNSKALENYIHPAIVKRWQEMLTSLEGTDRKLLNIESGSLILTLFCPTRESQLQLRDKTWKDEIQKKMRDLLKLLGAEVAVTLQTPEPIKIQHKRDPSDIRQRQKMQIADSEEHSVGYGTLTTVSDLDSELPESDLKMEGWLSQQQKSGTTLPGDKDQSIQLVKTWTLNHINADPGFVKATNRFTVSETGVVGISCVERPSLSMMYPDTDKPPVVLSNDIIYRSATYVMISGKEYLAAACMEDGCLYLWDTESKISKKVFDPGLPGGKRSKDMNIFKISDTTIGYGEVSQSPNGSRKVFILKMDSKQLTLSSTLRLFTLHNIYDMCYTGVEGGTPCILLCIPKGPCILLVEMIGGRARWEVGKEQMGEKFFPSSICTDDEKVVCVADNGQNKIHLLSALDGTVIKRFDPVVYDIYNIFSVRFHDQHLYLEHKIVQEARGERKYAITKFKQFKET